MLQPINLIRNLTGMLGKNRNAGWTEQFVRYKKYLLFRGFLLGKEWLY